MSKIKTSLITLLILVILLAVIWWLRLSKQELEIETVETIPVVEVDDNPKLDDPVPYIFSRLSAETYQELKKWSESVLLDAEPANQYHLYLCTDKTKIKTYYQKIGGADSTNIDLSVINFALNDDNWQTIILNKNNDEELFYISDDFGFAFRPQLTQQRAYLDIYANERIENTLQCAELVD